MCGSKRNCQRGSNSDNVFFFFFLLVDEGRDDHNTTKAGYCQPASETPLYISNGYSISMANDGLKLNDGLVFHGIWTSNAKKQHFYDFQWGSWS